jgi:hypothetical protein
MKNEVYYLKYLAKEEDYEEDDDDTEVDIDEVEEDKDSLLVTPFHSLLLTHTCYWCSRRDYTACC